MEKRWESFYEKSEEYDYYNLFVPHPYLAIVSEFFERNNVEKILDIGCGLGSNLLFLARKGFNMTGIDISAEAIKRLQERTELDKLNIPLFVGDFRTLPFSNESFEGVICIQTLQHGYTKDVQKGIEEISRVLKPQGFLFLTVPGRVTHGKVRYSLIETACKVEERVYIPTKGNEIGIPHFIFNMKTIRQFLRNYQILFKWRDENDYYCVLAKKI